MTISYKTVAIAAAGLSLVLCLVFFAAPERMLDTWGVTSNPSSDFVAKRLGALFLGMAVILASTRDIGPSPARTGICNGAIAAFTSLAILGAVEYFRGHVSAGIGSAVVVELAFAAAFLFVDRSGR
ncbi:MAG: hypothetical protein KGM42_11115 [Hyphomicrobiales bacterium]|nr:hypothetical protein [Hyphomicrobiales bacterium]